MKKEFEKNKGGFSITEITPSHNIQKENPNQQENMNKRKAGDRTKSNKKYVNKPQAKTVFDKLIPKNSKSNMTKSKENSKKKKSKLYIKFIGTKRKSTIILWILLLSSMLFGIYKNFTALNTHTIYEKEIVKQEVIDTNRIENFVRNFAKAYHSWDNNRQSIDKRTKQISYYLTNQLQILNLDTVRIDIPTSSKVNDIQIWSVIPKKDIKQSNTNADTNNDYTMDNISIDSDNPKGHHHKYTDENNNKIDTSKIDTLLEDNSNLYEVIYYVDQSITENKNTKTVLSSYKVTVHLKEDGNMVIIQNPTICSKPTKSDYEPKPMDIQIIDMQKQEEIEQFLKTFFTLYPKANDKELAYYVKNNVLQPVMKNYIFAELLNPIYQQQDNWKIKVYVSVKYLDEDTKMTMICQYELMLEKDDNWMIVG